MFFSYAAAMVSPFRTDDRTRLDQIGPVVEALQELQAEELLQQLFDRTLSDQLDRAIFVLVGAEDTTPFQTDPTLPDPRKAGSVLDKTNKTHDEMQQAIQQVLENSDQYPVNAR